MTPQTFDQHLDAALERQLRQDQRNAFDAWTELDDAFPWTVQVEQRPYVVAQAWVTNRAAAPVPCDNLDHDDHAPIVAAAPGGRRWSPRQVAALGTMSRLGAHLDASPTREAVRYAFRSLAHRLHPDTGGDESSAIAFAALVEAWELLRNGPVGGYDDESFHPIFPQGPLAHG